MSPYFDVLFELLARGDDATRAAFGEHVHWGYWPDSSAATGTPEDYGAAAQRLTEEILNEASLGTVQPRALGAEEAPAGQPAAGSGSGPSVLDVGCGFGGTIGRLNEQLDDATLVGVNIDPRQLRRAEQQVHPVNGNVIEWLCGDACDLPLPNQRAFDVVLAVECIFHFPSRDAFFREAAARMRPGSRLVLSDFVPSEALASYLHRSADALPGADALTASYGTVDLSTTLPQYEELGESHGMRLCRQRDITAETLPTYDFLLAHLKHWEDTTLAAAFAKATQWLAAASRKRMLTYQVLAFQSDR